MKKTTIILAVFLVFFLSSTMCSATDGSIAYLAHQGVHVRGETDYTLSSWVRTRPTYMANTATAPQLEIYVFENDADGEMTAMTKLVSQGQGQNWTWHEVHFTTDEDTVEVYFVISTYTPAHGSKEAYLEDLQLYETGARKVLNYLGNLYGCFYPPDDMPPEDTDRGDSLNFMPIDSYCAKPPLTSFSLTSSSNYFCSHLGYWKEEPKPGFNSTLSSTAPPGINLIPNPLWVGPRRNADEVFAYWESNANLRVIKNLNGVAQTVLYTSDETGSITSDSPFIYESGKQYRAGVEFFCEGEGRVSLTFGAVQDYKDTEPDYSRIWRNLTVTKQGTGTELSYSVSFENGPCVFRDLYVVEGEDFVFSPPFSEPVIPHECCPEYPDKYCWTGLECVNGSKYEDDITEPPIFGTFGDDEGYRCIDGEWELAHLKKDQNDLHYGYCANESYCFYHNSTSTNDIVSAFCVPPEFFAQDHYCEGGNWTSRTKLLALQLLDIVEDAGSDEYTLFCDDYDLALNQYDYPASGFGGGVPKMIQEYIIGQQTGGMQGDCGLGKDEEGDNILCVNRFCVLNYTTSDDPLDHKVIFGVSLNAPLNGSSDFSFLNVFEEALQNNPSSPSSSNRYDYCDQALKLTENITTYMGCGGKYNAIQDSEARIWVNQHTMGLIYSDQEMQIAAQDTGFFDRLKSFFTGLFGRIFDFIIGEVRPSDMLGYEFIKGVRRFDRIYLSQLDDVKITGITEKVGGKIFLNVNLHNLDFPICDLIYDEKSVIKLPDECSFYSGPTCYVDNVDGECVTHLEAQGYEGCDSLWPDLTAKIRLQGDKIEEGCPTPPEQDFPIPEDALPICEDDCDSSCTCIKDFDMDGYNAQAFTGGTDCNDIFNYARPSATETHDGLDNDCDGVIDEGFDADQDGYSKMMGDCDDLSSLLSPDPENSESCDGMDNDCDGYVDEGFDCICDSDGVCLNSGCRVTNSVCNYPVELEVLQSQTSIGAHKFWNSHAREPGIPIDAGGMVSKRRVCCNFGVLGTYVTVRDGGCDSGEEKILSLSEDKNAHVDAPDATNGVFTYDICMGHINDEIGYECKSDDRDGACEGDGWVKIITISDKTNAHIADARDESSAKYERFVCCRVVGVD